MKFWSEKDVRKLITTTRLSELGHSYGEVVLEYLGIQTVRMGRKKKASVTTPP
jgi:hypothetical protein